MLFSVGGTWDLMSISCTKRIAIHQGIEISYLLDLKRRTTFYLLNIILPVAFLSFTAPAVFLLPAETGEKMGISITILLAYSDLLLDDQIFIGTLFKGFKGRLLFLAANELDLG